MTNLTIEAISSEPRAFAVPGFLSEVEADHLILLGAGGIERSTVQGEVSRTRTSLNTWIRRDKDEITERIFRRLADVAKIPEEKMHHQAPGVVEMIQLVYYEPGQEYNMHHDWWVNKHNGPRSRFMTFLLYLSDKSAPPAGGDTTFPKCRADPGLAIHPGKGGAAFFYNLLEDGNPDDLSMHAAAPVTIGEKWFANVWIWDPVTAL